MELDNQSALDDPECDDCPKLTTAQLIVQLLLHRCCAVASLHAQRAAAARAMLEGRPLPPLQIPRVSPHVQISLPRIPTRAILHVVTLVVGLLSILTPHGQ